MMVRRNQPFILIPVERRCLITRHKSLMLFAEVDPIIRTTGLDRNPSVFLSRNRLCFWDSTKEGDYAKEEAFV